MLESSEFFVFGVDVEILVETVFEQKANKTEFSRMTLTHHHDVEITSFTFLVLIGIVETIIVNV